MIDFLCWVCRRRLDKELLSGELGWARCSLCGKTREQREPQKVKLQPITKRQRQKQVELRRKAAQK